MTMKTGTSTASSRLRTAILGALLAMVGAPALAHHGWSWAQEEQSTLQGTIVSVSMAPPHPSLQVKASDGSQWQVDLGNPTRTENSGFNARTGKAGDAITILGNRSKEPGKRLMKAVRLTIDGRHYDMYPERLAQTP